MLGRSFFFQVLVVAIFGLVLFAVLASLAMRAVGRDEYDYDQIIFTRTARLAELLIPPAEAPLAEQTSAVMDLASRLEFELTLFSPNTDVIAASAEPANWKVPSRDAGQWEDIGSQRLWLTKLADGRVLVVDIGNDPTLSDTEAFTIAVAVLGVVISILLYPIARRVTRRLETLRKEVAAIGPNNLSSRVTVNGKDEIAELAESFNRSTDLIEDLVSRQRLLLANASHELRTPLARLRLGVELLETKNTPARREDLRRDIHELDGLIDDLITMVRFDSGGNQEMFESTDLHEIAREEASQFESVDVRGDPTYLRGDVRMLRLLVRNLLNNAKIHGAAPITISTTQNGSLSKLSVTDGGPGISEADRARVFEPFFRGRGKQAEAGYGLGLPLVARIANAHGAKVQIENDPKSVVSVLFQHVR